MRFSETFSKSRGQFKQGFHKWRMQLVIAYKILYVIVAILFGIFRPDALIIIIYFMLYPYLFLTRRKEAFSHLFVSSLVALIWVIISRDQYGYNYKTLTIFGLNTFPLFAWASGLFIIYLIYSHLELKFKNINLLKKIILFVAFYWPMLIFFETIAYHVFNIHNLPTSMYVGLPICNCMHAPVWMQISYFALGPLYLLICELLGLKNFNRIRKKK